MSDIQTSVDRAARASVDEHLAALDSTACPICGAEPGVPCTYGPYAGRLAGQHWKDRVHTRRLRHYLDGAQP